MNSTIDSLRKTGHVITSYSIHYTKLYENSLLIDEIKPLGEANRSLYIRFDSLPDDVMAHACAFLKRYPGETPVVLYDAAKKIGKSAPKEYHVTITDAFLAAAEEKFGSDCVKLK